MGFKYSGATRPKNHSKLGRQHLERRTLGGIHVDKFRTHALGVSDLSRAPGPGGYRAVLASLDHYDQEQLAAFEDWYDDDEISALV